MARFTPRALEAYEAMTAPSPSLATPDFAVFSFNSGELDVTATGKGGRESVVRELEQGFAAGVAVALFRVTAVDHRGKATSVRTKTVHVVFVGPATPIMQRAKAFSADFQKPFTGISLSIHTNDLADLSEPVIEKALRASGGAHQPSYFDFHNQVFPTQSPAKAPAAAPLPAEPAAADADEAAAPAELGGWAGQAGADADADADAEAEAAHAAAALDADGAAPAAPAPAQAAECDAVLAAYTDAFLAKDPYGVSACYADKARLIVSDPDDLVSVTYESKSDILDFFERLFSAQHVAERNVGHIEKVPASAEDGRNSVVIVQWAARDAVAYACDTLVVARGQIAVHSMVWRRHALETVVVGKGLSMDMAEHEANQAEAEPAAEPALTEAEPAAEPAPTEAEPEPAQAVQQLETPPLMQFDAAPVSFSHADVADASQPFEHVTGTVTFAADDDDAARYVQVEDNGAADAAQAAGSAWDRDAVEMGGEAHDGNAFLETSAAARGSDLQESKSLDEELAPASHLVSEVQQEWAVKPNPYGYAAFASESAAAAVGAEHAIAYADAPAEARKDAEA